MDRKIDGNDKIDQVVNRLRKDVTQLSDAKIEISSDSKCKVLTTVDNIMSIIVSDNNHEEDAYTFYSKSKSNHRLCVIVFDELDSGSCSKHNQDNIPTLYISTVENDSFLDKIRIYFEVVLENEEIPSFKQIQEKTIECIKPEYIKNNLLIMYVNKAARIWRKYITFNKIYKIWSDQELEQAWWEKHILSATMTTQKSSTQADKSNRDTLKSTFIFDMSDGKKEYCPHIDEYIFNRYQEVDVAYVKRIFLEFLLFMKSNKFEKSKMLKQLLSTLEQEISDFKKINNNLIDLDISRSIHRYIGIIDIYHKEFKNDQNFLDNKIVFVKTHIKNLIDDKKFRWLIDIAECLVLYKETTECYFEDQVDLLIEQCQDLLMQENCVNQEHCINIVKLLKKYRGKGYNAEEKLAEIQYERAHQAMSKGSYLYATVLLREGLKILEKANFKGIYREKIQNWSNILKEWSLLAKKELKSIPKAQVSSESIKQIEAANNNCIAQLEKLNLKDRISSFFVHNTHFIDENTFLGLYKKYYKTSIISHFESTQFTDDGIVVPKNNKEKLDKEEFMFYSVIIRCYVENFTSLFDRVIGTLFTLNDIIGYLSNSDSIHEDDLKFIKYGLELFDSKQYAASVHILLPIIERFFRMFMKNMGKDVKYKTGGGLESNASLDTMIKDSVEAGFPKDAARFFRFFLSNKFGYNFRNRATHLLLKFEAVNHRTNAILVIWCVLFCYVNLKRVD